MKKIFHIFDCSGEYSDHQETLLVSFEDEQKAIKVSEDFEKIDKFNLEFFELQEEEFTKPYMILHALPALPEYVGTSEEYRRAAAACERGKGSIKDKKEYKLQQEIRLRKKEENENLIRSALKHQESLKIEQESARAVWFKENYSLPSDLKESAQYFPEPYSGHRLYRRSNYYNIESSNLF